LGACGAVIAGVVALAAAEPALFATGVRRVLTPWSDAAWPRRTGVEDLTAARVHPLGSALPLRAGLVAKNRGHTARVEAVYRLIDADGVAGPSRRLVLTNQERPAPGAATGAVLFERMIDAPSLEIAGSESIAEPGEVEYTFESDDDETEPVRVKLVRPPAVTAATLTVTPPAYLAGTDLSVVRTLELGAGNDERAVTSGVLGGSRVELRLVFNKPLPTSTPGPAWAEQAFGTEAWHTLQDQQAQVSMPTGAEARVTFNLTSTVRLPVRLVDAYGIRSEGECVYRVEAREDRAPDATVTRPSEDTDVLPTAVLETTVEGRDDVGLASVKAETLLARRPAGSVGAAPEPASEYATVAQSLAPVSEGAGEGLVVPARLLTAALTLDVSTLGAKPGEEIWITALATDIFALEGVVHDPVRSAVRKLRVISSEQFVEQVWNELGGVRNSAIGLAEQQQRARDALAAERDPSAIGRDQSGVSEGAARQQKALERIANRMDANRLDDADLRAMLQDARAMMESAREASAKATDELKAAAGAQNAGDRAEKAKRAAQAGQQQRTAQEALERAAESLDRGQDAWAARRGLERLSEEQRALRDETARNAAETTGRSAEELTPQQRAEAAQLAERQEELARRAEEAMRRMRERAEALRESNPSTAGALEQASDRGQREQLQRQMEKAAEDIRQNRRQNAGKQQEQSLRTMEAMLEEMENAAKTRDEVLARELASVIESVDALIRRQTAEVAALTKAMEAGPLDGRDEAQIRIRASTLGVAEQARAAGREARAVAEVLTAAAAAMSTAVGHLRVNPPDTTQAVMAEQEALAKLREAREKAETERQQAQERETRRKRAELKKAYRELLVEQTRIRAATEELSGIEQGRRLRAAARELSPPQDQIRQTAADLAAKNKEIGDSAMFGLAHRRIDETAAAAAARLADGEAGTRVTGRQSATIRTIEAILEALDDRAGKDEDDFKNGEQGNEGGGQQGGQQNQPPRLIPQMAELKLLRQLQAEALALTREAEGVEESQRSEAQAEAGRVQDELAKRAEQLLKDLMERGGGESDGEGDGDGEKEGGLEIPELPGKEGGV
ncbi:MAG: hypothetical protein ACT4PL_09930, partial [Phycisphaerales bacterium]